MGIIVKASNETENGRKVLLSMNCLPRDPLANLIYVVCQPRPNTVTEAWFYHHSHANISVDTVHEDVAAYCKR